MRCAVKAATAEIKIGGLISIGGSMPFFNKKDSPNRLYHFF